jgi:hypothetical protein
MSTSVVTATRPAELDYASDALRGSWLDFASARTTGEEFEIPFMIPASSSFYSSPRMKARATGVLRIREVVSVEQKDPNRVGSYDFRDLRFDERTRTLTVLTGIPLTLSLQVKGLDVSVEFRS